MLVENETAQTADITEEEADNADGTIYAENMFNDTAPGDDKECGDDAGAENSVSSEAAPGDDNECGDDEDGVNVNDEAVPMDDKECGDDDGAENASDEAAPGHDKE
ncbi:hypothetical protein MTO96_026070 [Rhipicephalus appendiculatus]